MHTNNHGNASTRVRNSKIWIFNDDTTHSKFKTTYPLRGEINLAK